MKNEPAHSRQPAANARHAGGGSGPMRWWLLLQGDLVELLESYEAPDITVQPGERHKLILGVYDNNNDAQQGLSEWSKRARGIVGKGVAY